MKIIKKISLFILYVLIFFIGTKIAYVLFYRFSDYCASTIDSKIFRIAVYVILLLISSIFIGKCMVDVVSKKNNIEHLNILKVFFLTEIVFQLILTIINISAVIFLNGDYKELVTNAVYLITCSIMYFKLKEKIKIPFN